MKFLQSGDSVVSLRFKYQGIEGPRDNYEAVPEAETLDSLMSQVSDYLEQIRGGEDLTPEQAADAQIILFSLDRDYSHEPKTDDQINMVEDLRTTAHKALRSNITFVEDPEQQNPFLEELSNDAFEALDRILSPNEVGEYPEPSAEDLQIVQNFAEQLAGSEYEDSASIKRQYAQAVVDHIRQEHPQFSGTRALSFLSKAPGDLREITTAMIQELENLRVEERHSALEGFGDELEALKIATESGNFDKATEIGLEQEQNKPAIAPTQRVSIASTVEKLPSALDSVLASLEEDTASRFGTSALAGFDPDSAAV